MRHAPWLAIFALTIGCSEPRTELSPETARFLSEVPGSPIGGHPGQVRTELSSWMADAPQEMQQRYEEAEEMLESALASIGVTDSFDDLFVGMGLSDHSPTLFASGSIVSDSLSAIMTQLDADSVGTDQWVLRRSYGVHGTQSVRVSRTAAGDLIARPLGEASPVADAPTVSLIEAAETVAGFDAWMVTTEFSIPNEMMREIPKEAARLGRAVSAFAAGASLEDDRVSGLFVLTPSEGVDAEDLADVVRGTIAVLRSRESDSIGQMLDQIDVTSRSSRVSVTWTVFREDLQRLTREADWR